MGVVYKAQDPEIDRLVAIKTLRSVFLEDDAKGNEALQRFRQESRSAGKLQHPNIVTIFEAGRVFKGSPFIVMAYIEGQSLEQVISERAPLDPVEILHYLGQVASAIDYAHTHNVIHRDIKPSNVLVDPFHRPHLLDFGVAKLSDTSLTPAGTVVGTPSYMSPEQIRGETLDGGTDLFAFAVVAYETFTGIRPFPGKDFTTVVSNILHKEPIPFAELDVEHPAEAEKVLRRCLSKDRNERFQSALEFVSELASVFSIPVDGLGLIGGYRPEMKVSDFYKGSANGASRSVPTTDKSAENDWSIDATEKIVPPKGGLKKEHLKQEKKKESKPNKKKEGDAKESWFGGGFYLLGGILVAVVAAGFFLKDDSISLKDNVLALLGSGFSEPGMSAPDEPDDTNVSPDTGAADDGVKPSDAVNPDEAARLDGVEKPPDMVDSTQAVQPDDVITEPDIEDPTPTDTPKVIDVSTIALSDVSQLDDASLAFLLGSELLRGSAAFESGVRPKALLRASVSEAANRTNDNITRQLSRLAEHPSYLLRIEVLKALSREQHYGLKSGFQGIVTCLGDKEYLVRGYAGKVIGYIPGEESIKALENRLQIEQHEVVKKLIQQSLLRLQEIRLTQ